MVEIVNGQKGQHRGQTYSNDDINYAKILLSVEGFRNCIAWPKRYFVFELLPENSNLAADLGIGYFLIASESKIKNKQKIKEKAKQDKKMFQFQPKMVLTCSSG